MNMLKIICFCTLLVSCYGHQGKMLSDADAQSALMPQELNPAFISGKDEPWQAIIPIPRQRRNVDMPMIENSSTVAEQIKRYSRVIACVVLVMSAAIEIVLYMIQAYSIV